MRAIRTLPATAMLRYLARSTLAICVLSILLGCTSDAANSPGAAKKATKKKARSHLVVLATVESRTLRSSSTYTGSLRYRTSVRIFNQEEGRLLELPYYEGDPVAKGVKLFGLDTALLDAELRKAAAVLREASANLKRSERLRRRKMASEEELLRARTVVEVAKAEREVLRTRRGYTQATAPFDGLVAARLAEPGDVVARHTHLLTLVDPASLVTELDVSELVIPHLAKGVEVVVRIDALGDEGYTGRVLRVHPEINPRTRQGRVEVTLMPLPQGARSGLFARVTFKIEALERRVMPFSALRRDRNGEYVFRIDPAGKARRVGIRGGRRVSDQVEILEGLHAGDRVVTKGFLGLKDGKKVTEVPSERRPGEKRTT